MNDNEQSSVLNKQNQISLILSSTTLYLIKNPVPSLYQLIKHLFLLEDSSCRLLRLRGSARDHQGSLETDPTLPLTEQRSEVSSAQLSSSG